MVHSTHRDLNADDLSQPPLKDHFFVGLGQCPPEYSAMA